MAKPFFLKAIFTLMMFFVVFQHLKAQETVVPEYSKAPLGFEIEADPFAYFLSGYSFHVAHTFSHFRTSLGVFGLSQPDFILDNDSFELFSSGYDMKVDYLFGRLKGLFLGAQVTYGKDDFTLKDESDKKTVWGGSYGLRTGYRFMWGKAVNQQKGLYIVPWLAMLYSPNAKTVYLGTEVYKQSSWTPFPTIHIGWRF